MLTHAEIVDYLNNHLVAIVFTFQEGSEKKYYAITAFVLSVLDHWFLITAGHCIRDMVKHEEKGYELIQCQLIDYLGLKSSHYQAIPFLFKNSYAIFLRDDYAIDYGVIKLSNYYRQLLESNNIIAFDEEVWKKQPFNADCYKLLGIPGELIKVDPEKINISTILINVERVKQKPEGFPEVDIPLFYGHVELGEELTSILGMSGGPIFAFQQNDKGKYKYWLTALQSLWLTKSHFIAACPTKLLGLFLENEMISFDNELGSKL